MKTQDKQSTDLITESYLIVLCSYKQFKRSFLLHVFDNRWQHYIHISCARFHSAAQTRKHLADLFCYFLVCYLTIRKYYSFLYRYDYENVDSKPAEQMMTNLNAMVADQSLVGKTFSQNDKSFKVAKMDNFEYTDPIDKSFTQKQVNTRVSHKNR